MRIPSTKVYRAFPELDRFSDEQCRRFAAAAKGSIWRRMRHLAMELLVAGCALGLVAGAAYGIDRWWPAALALRLLLGVRAELARDGLVLVCGLGGPTLAFLLVRDWLVRRSIRRVVNTRGSCGVCGYGLTSLMVTETNTVRCPECGHEITADESFGEIAVDAAGIRRYLPSPDLVGTWRWLTPRRRRWMWRALIGGPIAAVVLLGGFWGAYEIFLWRQARLASSQRPTAASIEARAIAFSVGSSNDPNAWDSFARADAVLQTSDLVWRNANGGAPKSLPDFSMVAYPFYGPAHPDAKVNQDDVALALRMLEVYRADGVFRILDEMAPIPRKTRRISWPGGAQPLMPAFAPELGRARSIARINNARMKLAAIAGDLGEFRSALTADVTIRGMLRSSPVLIDHMVADAIQALDFVTVREILARQPGGAWADAIAEIEATQIPGLPIAELIACERDSLLNVIGWIFQTPANVRFGVLSRPIRSLGIVSGRLEPFKHRVGSFRENRDWLNQTSASIIAALASEPYQRAPLATAPPPGVLLQNMLSAEMFLRSQDARLLHERSLQYLCALERYRDARGEYPLTLADLVPEYLPELPADPWSGRPFGYRRLERGTLEVPRFLLYSIGGDFSDDNGKGCGEVGQWRLLAGRSSACDFLVNFDRERDAAP